MNLDDIGKKYGTDKAKATEGNGHDYLRYYETLFNLQSIRNEKLKILEIGIWKGASIRMWEEYFPNSMIYAIDDGTISSDVLTKTMNEIKSDRVFPFIGDQSNRADLQRFIDQHGSNFDLIVDDGLHFQQHQQISLGFLFQHLVPGGLYIVEDIALPISRYAHERPDVNPWGIKDKKSFRDSTFVRLLDFVDTGSIMSEYMTQDEMEYLNTHVAKSQDFHGLDIRFISCGSSSSFISIRKNK